MQISSLSLKVKVSGAVLLFFVASFCLLTYFITTRLAQDMVKVLENQQFSIASYIAADLEDKFQHRIELLNKNAEMVTPELLANPAKAREFLKTRIGLQALFKAGLILLSPEGDGIADYPPILERGRASFSNAEYFQEVVTTGKTAIGKPIIGRFSGQPLVAFAAPIKNKSGRLAGVLVGSVHLSDTSLFGQVENAHVGETGYIAVDVPQYRLIATSSNASRRLQPMAAPGVNAMLDRFVAGDDGSGISINSLGVENLTSAKHIPATGWIVQIVLPTKEAFEPVHQMMIRAYSIAAMLSALVFMAVWFVIRHLLAPLSNAAKAVSEMSPEVYEPLPVTHHDEIGILIQNFNALGQKFKRMELALRESEWTLSTIIETEPECVKILALDGTLVRMNRAGLDMIEADSEDQVRGAKMYDFVVPEHRGAFIALSEKVMLGGSGTLEFEIIGLKGGHCWLETHAVPMRDSEGQISGLLGITRDITERKRAVEALFEAEKRNRELIKYSPVGIFQSTPEGHYLSVNTRLVEMYGYDSEQDLIESVQDIKTQLYVDPSDREKILRALDAGPVDRVEVKRRRKDGSIIWVSLSMRPVRDQTGAILRYEGFASDITGRILAEENLRSLAATDPLTGIANRRHFLERANEELARSSRYGQPLVFLMLDIDHFKDVNDTFGHDAGDEVLKSMVSILQEILRATDVIGRLGGEEFGALLVQTAIEGAQHIAERLRAAFQCAAVETKSGPVRYTASIGLALCTGTGDSVEDIVKRADLALYNAKETGRNRVRCFGEF